MFQKWLLHWKYEAPCNSDLVCGGSSSQGPGCLGHIRHGWQQGDVVEEYEECQHEGGQGEEKNEKHPWTVYWHKRVRHRHRHNQRGSAVPAGGAPPLHRPADQHPPKVQHLCLGLPKNKTKKCPWVLKSLTKYSWYFNWSGMNVALWQPSKGWTSCAGWVQESYLHHGKSPEKALKCVRGAPLSGKS